MHHGQKRFLGDVRQQQVKMLGSVTHDELLHLLAHVINIYCGLYFTLGLHRLLPETSQRDHVWQHLQSFSQRDAL